MRLDRRCKTDSQRNGIIDSFENRRRLDSLANLYEVDRFKEMVPPLSSGTEVFNHRLTPMNTDSVEAKKSNLR